MTAQSCPHCSAPTRDDGRPRCLCEAAGAEDFDPLRVRPYVQLPDGAETTGTAAGPTVEAMRPDPRPAPRFGSRTVPPAGSRSGARAGARAGLRSGGRAGAQAGPRAGSPADTCAAPHTGAEARTDAYLSTGTDTDTYEASRRRKKQAALAAMAVSAAGLAAGAVLLSGALLNDADQDRALPDNHRHMPSAARTPGSGDGGPVGGGPGRRAAPPSAVPTPAPQRVTRAQPSAGPSRTSSPTPGPSSAPRTATASGSITSAPESRAPSSPPEGPMVLREGASGPEVLELQRRLEQVAVYPGPEDGRFDVAVRDAVAAFQRFHGLRQDPAGVYGVQTRRSLEARTVEP
ncbi:peptidoglycan-binding protein [Streptomyces monomycini]|uniref:peptidoglycan-binding protein n=1 Tax=Streptomyces monomycini TaxID=371720 RepID=UPI00067CAC34|nr:peptidoglycan-binding protein [Streptomyces monomycini]